MNFAPYFPSLKYLCLLSTIRKGDARLFRRLYKEVVNEKNLIEDINIHWLYYCDKYAVNSNRIIILNFMEIHLKAAQLCAAITNGLHEPIAVPIVSSGCAFAGYAFVMLSGDAFHQNTLRQMYEWLMRDRSVYMIEHLLHEPTLSISPGDFNDTFMILCYMRNTILNQYALKHLADDDKSIGVHSALLFGEKCDFMWKTYHVFAMAYGLTLKYCVEVPSDKNEAIRYYEKCRDSCIAAWRTWLLVSTRLGLCRDLRRLIGEWVQSTLWWDGSWAISYRVKNLKKSP